MGTAEPFPGSERTGLFWFFNPANVELIVKNLDGSTVNGFIWTFYGALSDVEYWITVTDTAEGRNRTYHNRPGEICGRGDTASFPEAAATEGGAIRYGDDSVADLLEPDGAAPPPLADGPRASLGGGSRPTQGFAVPRSAAPPADGLVALPSGGLQPAVGAGTGACTPGEHTLCLLGGRFEVEVDWHDQHNGGSGQGQAVPGTDKTGFFWFFNSSNVELVVKMLDATGVNGHFWAFWGALSDVEYTITVTDTVTATPVTYHNPPGEICGDADTEAF